MTVSPLTNVKMAGVQEGLQESLQNLKGRLPEPLSTYEFTVNIIISLAIGLVTLLLILYYVLRMKMKVTVLPSRSSGPPKPRFRKRDKVLFYGRKMLRKLQDAKDLVKTFTKNTIRDVSVSGGRTRSSRRKQIVMKIARKLLRFKKDQTPQLKRREPPPSFLEADLQQLEHFEQRLPPEVMYMLRSVRVLGHFEKPIFLELCKYTESKFIPAGNHVFRIGDPDDSIYVVQSGKVDVYITDSDGTPHTLKQVQEGETIHSLLSILDQLTGHPAAYKTVEAVAVVDTTILRLPAEAFKVVLDRFPESLVRVVQIIMVRLQRVTFMALHNYLGLSFELMNPENLSDPSYSIHSLHVSPKGSPQKVPRDNRTSVFSTEGERIYRVINYEDDGGTSPLMRRFSTSLIRRPSLPDTVGKSVRSLSLGTVSDIPAVPSDFDAACSRARVATDDKGTTVPPLKLSEENVSGSSSSATITAPSTPAEVTPSSSATGQGGQGTPRRLCKRTVISDNVSVIPDDTSSMRPVDNNEVLELATQDISKLLGLEDKKLLTGKLVLRHILAGTDLIRQADQDATLIFVVTGMLQVLQQVVGKEEQERSLFVVHPGEIVGSLAVLTGEPSFFTTRARTDARVVTISKRDFYSIMKEHPTIVLNVAHTVVKRMSAFVRQIDFALDWMRIEAGRAVFRQGEPSECIFIVLNGRLRSVVTQLNGKKELIGEYGRGELVGLVEVLTQTERATTMMAVRDTEVAVIPEELLNMIKRKYPQIVTRLIHLLGQRILGSLKNRPPVQSALSEHPNVDPRPAVANLATVAVVPVSEDVPLTNFTLELQHALNSIGPTLCLTSDIILNKLGNAAFDTVNEYRLLSWLGQQEDIHRMVLYQCDHRMTPWTHHCIRQADCILIVGLGEKDPTVGKVEKQMENLAVRAQKELILLYKDDGSRPNGTIDWLNARGWCTSHHHLRCPKRVFSRKSYSTMVDLYQRLAEKQQPDRLSDFSRLARFLTGTAVGLVLGGGGARGIAHVGMIRAMHEAGIPIDMVGGTSIGSMFGAVWCDELNITRCTQRAREWSSDMSKLWKKVLDLTYPVTAMFTGASFNRSIEATFRNRQIEDLWLPYFCITTDITASKMRVHTSGSLWRYVRASMSLSGYLPPLCDPVDGHLLLDGGYVNNLPADVMKAMGAQTIFAVDVGSQDETDLFNYGDDLSGWWLLWKRWNPWATQVKVPNMAEIQSRLAYVSCVRTLEQVKKAPYCEYIRPPIDRYQTLQFGAFDEINDVGYHHAKALFSTWIKSDLVSNIFKEKSEERMKPILHQTNVPREADFTDLAELISRIDEPMKDPFYIPSDDEYEDEDDDEGMSVTSEPAVETLTPIGVMRPRTCSEGASPSLTPTEESPPTLRKKKTSKNEEMEEYEDDESDF